MSRSCPFFLEAERASITKLPFFLEAERAQSITNKKLSATVRPSESDAATATATAAERLSSVRRNRHVTPPTIVSAADDVSNTADDVSTSRASGRVSYKKLDAEAAVEEEEEEEEEEEGETPRRGQRHRQRREEERDVSEEEKTNANALHRLDVRALSRLEAELEAADGKESYRADLRSLTQALPSMGLSLSLSIFFLSLSFSPFFLSFLSLVCLSPFSLSPLTFFLFPPFFFVPLQHPL